jgi:hypothetical protein
MPNLSLRDRSEACRFGEVSFSQRLPILSSVSSDKITDEELENEKGRSGLRYSFDIKRGTVTQEVGVDAQTGKVLENKKGRSASGLTSDKGLASR